MSNFWKDKKVVVTGAAGFIGSHVVDSLASREAKVTALVSPSTDEVKVQHTLHRSMKSINIQKVDLLDRYQAYEYVSGHDFIFHFAALDGGREFKAKHPAEIFIANVSMTINMLESAKNNNVNRFLFMSSIDVYPPNKSGLIDEKEVDVSTLPIAAGYAWAKRTGEIASRLYAEQYGIGISIIRAGNIYGPRDYGVGEKARAIPSFIISAMKDEDIIIYGNGQFKKSFLYVDDFSKAALDSLEKFDVACPINVVSSHYITLEHLANLVIKKTNSKSRIKYIQNKEPNFEKVFSNEKAKEHIGFSERTDLDTGIEETINWFSKINN